MPVKLQLKNSTVKGRQPDPADLDYGELCVNAHSDSPAIFFKDNAGGLIKIGPGASVPEGNSPPGSGNQIGDLYWDSDSGFLLVWNGSTWVVAGVEELSDLKDVDTDGVVDGMVLAYDSGTWTAVSAASIAIDVDLGYTAAGDKGTITNTAGDDATIPLANGTNAGLTLNNYSTADKDKLAGIPGDAEKNAPTNLNWVPDASSGVMESSTGTGATIPLGNGINAGLSLNDFSDEAKDKLDGYPDDPGDLPTPDLQAVTEAGNETTESITVAGVVTPIVSAQEIDADITLTAGASNKDVRILKGALSLEDGANQRIRAGQAEIIFSSNNCDYTLGASGSQAASLNVSGNSTTPGDVTLYPPDTGNVWGVRLSAPRSDSTDAETKTIYTLYLPANKPQEGQSIYVQADGTLYFADGLDPAVLDDYLPLAGGNMTGGVTATVRTVAAGAGGFDLATGNLWECGGIAVPNPDNAVAGMTGVIVFSAAPTAFGSNFKFPDGTPIAPSSFPAVAPFYVKGSSEILVGKAVEGIA